MNIHDPRRGGLNYPRLSANVRLYAPRFVLTQKSSRNTNLLCMRVYIQAGLPFDVVLGNDPFLRVLVWNLFLGAVGV